MNSSNYADVSLVEKKQAPRLMAKRRKPSDLYYTMQTVKDEPNGGVRDDNSSQQVITFVVTESANHSEKIECDEYGVTSNKGTHTGRDINVNDAPEHVCNKCFKSFRRLKGLKKHLDFCQYDSGYQLRKDEMLKNIDKIEKDATAMEKKDICFCCGESYDTCHLGHINCPDCPKSFKTQSSYERHIFITHSEENDFPCSICNAKLRTATLHKFHEEQHKMRGKPYACKICGKDFTRAYHLKRHQKYSSCSVSSGDAMSCKVCDRVFYRLDNLRSHLKQHLGTVATKKPEYMCHVCKNCFYSLSTLNIHIRTHTGEKPFDCDLCDKKFSALVALKKHRRYHTGEKPYNCQECHQSFAVKEVLNRHMKRHTGERPHKCSDCGKSFIQATQLRTHSKTHIRPFPCVHCQDKFKTQKQLERHQKDHGKVTRARKYTCSQCKLNFPVSRQLKEHMATNNHQDQRKRRTAFRTDCAICDKNFGSVEMLKLHILKVHDCDPDDIFGSNSKENGIASPSSKTPKLLNSECSLTSVKVREVYFDKCIDNIECQQFSSAGTHDKRITFGNKSIESYTVINLNDLESVDVKPSHDSVTAAASVRNQDIHAFNVAKHSAKTPQFSGISSAVLMETLGDDDLKLRQNISRLIDMLVDKITLKKFGWPDSSAEFVLCKVIENCGYKLDKSADYQNLEYGSRMREYTKLLFSVVIQNDIIRELLNNYSIDDVIDYVLNDESDEEA